MSGHPILIVDLEATCWDSSTSETQPQTLQSMEIIEIGCALATRQGAVLDARSFLVRPVRQPQLSDFCTQLTHITQSMVDGALPLADAIAQMNVWLSNISDDFTWGSWGNYDLHHLTTQCAIDGANSALLKHDHLNLKKLWRRTTRQRKRTSLAAALDFHDIEFAGQPHRGIDDAQNIARILPFMDWSLEAEIITTRETSMHM